MFKKIFLLCFLLCATALPAKEVVLVSVAPTRTFVKEIAGDTVDVKIVVPAGADSHTFEPTPKQMLEMSHAAIWFRLGDGFEPKLLRLFNSYSPNMEIVDLRENVTMMCQPHHHHENGSHSCSEDARDIHTWLSPKEVKKQALTIANALIKRYPKNKDFYEERLTHFLNRLDDLNRTIQKTLQDKKGTTILVSHPAYGYFARDYGLIQVSIEFDGKDPTPRQLTNLLKMAKEKKICTIFTQPQHSNKGAKLLAKEIGAEVMPLDPYSEDYFANMRKLAESFRCEKKH